MELRIGNGYDIHRLIFGRKLFIGGIEIPFEKGLLGHSDGDCVCHSITDALLGALALANIGQFFPNEDPETNGMDSKQILKTIHEREILSRSYSIINIDSTIIAQEPKLAPHIEKMRTTLGEILNISSDCLGIKATTNEGLDSIGQGEAIACYSVCLLKKIEIKIPDKNIFTGNENFNAKL
ncbi:MAG: 2-C-methyl-D-erythritol 2,4-cyclodiphosphate synthase [Puniceicoccales bacterium]|jgi:2-C-methyl-D-erythritol 2,4-cyclodiphosphate synthase|nr:2-C-methyl-D-erythritol 2,4-cyclodiphosphate synthase [Puniceicoccales bacterium]